MEERFDPSQRKIILNLARDAIRNRLESKIDVFSPPHEFLNIPAATFVTIRISGELRGCIGTTEATRPLGETIISCAVSAAFRDPRFPPLRSEEYPQIDLEVSVLSLFRRIQAVEQIEVGKHGLVLSLGHHRGLLLPQVAAEQGWDRDTFIQYTCRKAGLTPNAWKNPETIIEIFTAEVFGEMDQETIAPVPH